jgi:hypothetical protein
MKDQETTKQASPESSPAQPSKRERGRPGKPDYERLSTTLPGAVKDRLAAIAGEGRPINEAIIKMVALHNFYEGILDHWNGDEFAGVGGTKQYNPPPTKPTGATAPARLVSFAASCEALGVASLTLQINAGLPVELSAALAAQVELDFGFFVQDVIWGHYLKAAPQLARQGEPSFIEEAASAVLFYQLQAPIAPQLEAPRNEKLSYAAYLCSRKVALSLASSMPTPAGALPTSLLLRVWPDLSQEDINEAVALSRERLGACWGIIERTAAALRALHRQETEAAQGKFTERYKEYLSGMASFALAFAAREVEREKQAQEKASIVSTPPASSVRPSSVAA